MRFWAFFLNHRKKVCFLSSGGFTPPHLLVVRPLFLIFYVCLPYVIVRLQNRHDNILGTVNTLFYTLFVTHNYYLCKEEFLILQKYTYFIDFFSMSSLLKSINVALRHVIQCLWGGGAMTHSPENRQ